MPLSRALARETEHVQLSHAEKKKLRKLARDAGLSPSNYLRSFIGLPERSPGRPTIEQLEREQDQAWEMLKSLGEDPAAYFPPDDDWMDDYRQAFSLQPTTAISESCLGFGALTI